MKDTNLWELTINSAAKLIREREISSEELVSGILQRIESTECKVKAYLTICKDDALELARTADAQIRAGHDFGPLHGIPIAIKDIIETKGIKTTCGSKLLDEYVPDTDASVVKRLKSAGAIILGKTNAHEFAMGITTPPTRNPWDLDRIPGGSSGGSGAAVAASSAIAAIGTDSGGSIRIPASFCGVVGFKPTYGWVSRDGVFPGSWSFDHVGPIAKVTEDCAIIMNAIAGYDKRDPASTPMPVPDFTRDLKLTVSGLRLGVPRNYFFERIAPEVLASVRDATKIYEQVNASIVPIEFPMIQQIMASYNVIGYVETSAYYERFFREKNNLENLSPDARNEMAMGFFFPAVNYVNAQRVRGIAMQQVLKLFNQVDAIITPTVPIVAPKIGENRVMIDGSTEEILSAATRLLAPFNLTGLPAITICCGFSSQGMPIGMQIVGKPYGDATILRLAYAFEKASSWHERHPNF